MRTHGSLWRRAGVTLVLNAELAGWVLLARRRLGRHSNREGPSRLGEVNGYLMTPVRLRVPADVPGNGSGVRSQRHSRCDRTSRLPPWGRCARRPANVASTSEGLGMRCPMTRSGCDHVRSRCLAVQPLATAGLGEVARRSSGAMAIAPCVTAGVRSSASTHASLGPGLDPRPRPHTAFTPQTRSAQPMSPWLAA